MKRNVHDAPGLFALLIEHIKLPADYFLKIRCGDVSALEGLFVIDVVAVRHRDERFPVIQRHQVRLIVVGAPIVHILAAGDKSRLMIAVCPPSRISPLYTTSPMQNLLRRRYDSEPRMKGTVVRPVLGIECAQGSRPGHPGSSNPDAPATQSSLWSSEGGIREKARKCGPSARSSVSELCGDAKEARGKLPSGARLRSSTKF